MKNRKKNISKGLMFMVCAFFTLIVQGQNKKMNASINHEYGTQNSPIEINYKIFPYGGSGNYQYRWRLKDEKFGSYASTDVLQINFDCQTEERPEVTMFCQIKDQLTGETYTAVLKHPVEFCMN